MVAEPIFINTLFTNFILPFILVFVLIFALLDKSKLLGDDKKQINAIISLVIGLILIAFEGPRMVIVKLVPFLAVAAVILFVFMLLWGFVSGKKEDVLNKGLKITLGIIVGLGVVVAVLWITGAWDVIYEILVGSNAASIWVNVLFLAIIGGAIAVVLATGGKEKD